MNPSTLGCIQAAENIFLLKVKLSAILYLSSLLTFLLWGLKKIIETSISSSIASIKPTYFCLGRDSLASFPEELKLFEDLLRFFLISPTRIFDPTKVGKGSEATQSCHRQSAYLPKQASILTQTGTGYVSSTPNLECERKNVDLIPKNICRSPQLAAQPGEDQPTATPQCAPSICSLHHCHNDNLENRRYRIFEL